MINVAFLILKFLSCLKYLQLVLIFFLTYFSLVYM